MRQIPARRETTFALALSGDEGSRRQTDLRRTLGIRHGNSICGNHTDHRHPPVETTGFRIIEGFPCLITADDHQYVPPVLMPKYPDATCYDAGCIAGHTAQMVTILVAYEAYQG